MSTYQASTSRPNKGPAWRLLGLLVATSFLAGCAALGSKPEDVVKRRAEERWSALIAGQYEKAYDYLAPSSRKILVREQYRHLFGSAARWEKAEVVDVRCERDTCKTRVRLTVQIMARGAPKASPEVTEDWLLDEGQWWLHQKI